MWADLFIYLFIVVSQLFVFEVSSLLASSAVTNNFFFSTLDLILNVLPSFHIQLTRLYLCFKEKQNAH